jgi:hypothetical protein
MNLGWLWTPANKTWQVIVAGLLVAVASGAVRYALKHDVGDAVAWGATLGAASAAGGAFRLLRKGGPTDQPGGENLPPYGGEWPPAH